MIGKEQSRDLYRNDNLCKKTWRCLRQIMTQKAYELIQSLPFRFRKEPISVHAKIKSFLRSYKVAQDYETYHTLVACILFLSMRRTYAKFIQMLPLEPKVQKMMIKKAKEFKEINNNKTSSIKWSDILTHPLFRLAKSLFYKDRQSQDVFFIKALGCVPRDLNSVKTRMTIIDDYQLFRVKMLYTLEKRFKKLH